MAGLHYEEFSVGQEFYLYSGKLSEVLGCFRKQINLTEGD